MYDGIQVSAIAAVARNGVVGKDGQLPWHIPADLKYFKRTTKHHACIMGRRTFDEIKTPLRRRLNVVLSGQLEKEAKRLVVVRSLEQGLAVAAEHERKQLAAGRIEAAEIMVIGGPSVWRLAWPLVDRFYLTRVLQDFDGDTYLGELPLDDFDEVSAVAGEGDIAHEFVVLQRR